ncbi:MAG TPA: protein kinase [Bryobacteraceae bacterium]|nr:protein kinase [Bryobacteraceae bacterium]
MTGWEKAKSLYEEAAALPAAGRTAFLKSRTEGEEELRREVESLLAYHTAAGDFLETPAPAHAIPERLGNYRVLHEIGRGGMSVVYLGERADGLFEKQVAVKVLRDGIFGDDFRRRFHVERQLLARFDHPHIVRVIDGGITADGRPYLIQDYVDGQPITEFVNERKLSWAERLRLFASLCEAVAYSHSHGVVHRDLKPSNILVSRDGVVKLLDFGIAKLLDQPPGDRATLTRNLMWTPAYASPEQARGDTVGPASDIYSLGTVLYEIVTNKPACAPQDVQPIQAARRVAEHSADCSRLPRQLAVLFARCFAKKPEDRWESAAALAFEIRRVLDAGALFLDSVPADTPQGPPRRRLWFAASATIAAIMALALALESRGERKMRAFPLTADTGTERFPSLSPDGKSVVYTIKAGGGQILMRKDLDGSNTRPLTDGSQSERYGRWSPDGKWIAQVSGGSTGRRDVGVMAAGGGPERKISTSEGIFPAWTPDSKSLVVADRATAEDPFQLVMLGVNDGSRRQLTAPERGHWGDIAGAVSPDGKWLAIIRYAAKGSGDLYVMPLSGGPLRRLTHVNTWINGLDWMPNGREIVYASCSPPPDAICGLWRIAIAGANGPRLLPGLPTAPYPEWPSISGGKPLRVVVQTKTVYERLWSLRLDSGNAEPVVQTTYTRMAANPSFSRDGRQAAFVSNETRGHNIWIGDAGFRQRRQLTFLDSMGTETPRWSPSGTEIAFMAFVGGLKSIYMVEVASGLCRRLTKDAAEEGSPAWSTDGRWICFRSTRGGQPRIWRIRADGVGDATKLTGSPVTDLFSVGGDEILFLRSTDGSQVWKTRFEGGVERPLDPATLFGLSAGFWTVARDSIYFLREPTKAPYELWRYELGSGKLEMLRTLVRQAGMLRGGIGVHPDGSALYWTAFNESLDLAWIENIR